MKPSPTPPSEMRPARRPWLMLRDTTYIMFGPGVSTIPSERADTPRNDPKLITIFNLPGRTRALKSQCQPGGFDRPKWTPDSRPDSGRPVRDTRCVRQYVYFALFSELMPAEEMARRLGLSPDEADIRASRQVYP